MDGVAAGVILFGPEKPETPQLHLPPRTMQVQMVLRADLLSFNEEVATCGRERGRLALALSLLLIDR